MGCFSSWSLKNTHLCIYWAASGLSHSTRDLRCIVRDPSCSARPPAAVHGLRAPWRVRSQFPDQGSDLRPLQCQVDSQPLDPQGRPSSWISEGISDSVWFFLSFACPCASLPHLRSLRSRGMSQGSLVPGPFWSGSL